MTGSSSRSCNTCGRYCEKNQAFAMPRIKLVQRADSSIGVHSWKDAADQNFWKWFVRTGSGLPSRDPAAGYYSSRSGSPVRICEA